MRFRSWVVSGLNEHRSFFVKSEEGKEENPLNAIVKRKQIQ